MAFRDLGIAHLKSKASPPSSLDPSRGGKTFGPDARKRLWLAARRIAERIAAEVWDTVTTLATIAAALALLYALGLR